MVKKCILVLGPESTGTRLATRILIASGCKGTFEHKQEFDDRLPKNDKLIVWRRSVPHGGVWPNINEMVLRLSRNKYTINAVVTTRDFYSVAKSQIRNKHVSNIDYAIDNIRRAYSHIFFFLYTLNIPFVVFSYEAILARPEKTIKANLGLLGLTYDNHIPIKDGNAKFYGE